jgi:DNA-binding MarR family transcriptional regulator
MEAVQLNEEQRKMLAWIERAGAVSPSQLAAETKKLPQETWDMLEQLESLGYVVIRRDPDSADGTLVFLAPMATQAQVKQRR